MGGDRNKEDGPRKKTPQKEDGQQKKDKGEEKKLPQEWYWLNVHLKRGIHAWGPKTFKLP